MPTVDQVLSGLSGAALRYLAECRGEKPTDSEESLRHQVARAYSGRLESLLADIQFSPLPIHPGPAESTSAVPRSHPVPLEMYSSRSHGAGIGCLGYPLLKDALAGATSLDVATAFYDRRFFRELLRPRADARRLARLRLLVNGLRGARLREQVEDLRKLQEEHQDSVEVREIRLRFEPGIYHAKIYLFRGATLLGFVGSANATDAAMMRNEEVLLGLEQGAETVAAYFENAWKSATALEQIDPGAVSADSLISFFRMGVLYFRITSRISFSFNPFTELLALLDDPQKRALLGRKIAIPHCEEALGIGPFNLRRAADGAAADDPLDDSVEERINVQIRPFAVETSLGYWVPAPFQPDFEAGLARAGAGRRLALERVRDALRGRGVTFCLARYWEYVHAVRAVLAGAGLPVEDLVSRLRSDPFAEDSGFRRFFQATSERLDDPGVVDRACRGFDLGHLPEIWDDPIACEEFCNSFMAYLEYLAQRPERLPRVAATIRHWCRYPQDATASDIQWAMEDFLRRHGWTPEMWEAARST